KKSRRAQALRDFSVCSKRRSVLQLKHGLDLHREIAGQHVDADGRTRGDADLLAEKLAEQRGRAVRDGGLAVKVVRARDENEDLDAALDAVEIAELRLQHRKHVEHRVARIALALLEREVDAELALDRRVDDAAAARNVREVRAERLAGLVQPAARGRRRKLE